MTIFTSTKIKPYFHTIRYLKLSQIYWQIIRRLYRPKISNKIRSIHFRKNTGLFILPILKNNYIQENKITFLNQSIPFDNNIFDRAKSQSQLWQYNLHYFNGLLSQDKNTVEKTKALLADWIRIFPMYTKIAWDPYPISIRVVNIIKYQLLYHDLPKEIVDNIYLQTRYLYKIPEYQLLGNHLFENAKTLVFAGVFFNTDESKKWVRLGIKILNKEINRQILDDGGFFELSPMYHALAQELLLDMVNLFQSYQITFSNQWMLKLQKMRFWLQVMTHPNGEIAFFNDAALGVAPTLFELEQYAERLNLPTLKKTQEKIIYLQNSGYLRLQNKNLVAILDCAKIGPDYQPAHAHADTLSFELSVFGKRCIVNSGTSTYGEEVALRQWQRGTRAHSTVEINQQNSSEMWGIFRVARRAKPTDLQIEQDIVRCSHHGYKKIGAKHTRTWKLFEEEFSIEDDCENATESIARFYLHPETTLSENKIILENKKIYFDATSPVLISKSNYYPEFGKSIESHVLTCVFSKNNCIVFNLRSGDQMPI